MKEDPYMKHTKNSSVNSWKDNYAKHRFKWKQIQAICKRIGKEISDKLAGDERIPVLVGVLKGSLNFMLDLMKYISIPFYTDYIQISSYKKTERQDTVRLVKDISFDCYDRSVVIVEDIVDTGYSMDYLIRHLAIHHPKCILDLYYEGD